MTKIINIPEIVNDDLAAIAEELTKVAKKPISPAMTISLLIAVYRAHLSEPCAQDAFMQRIANTDFMSPEEFEKNLGCSIPKKIKRENKSDIDLSTRANQLNNYDFERRKKY